MLMTVLFYIIAVCLALVVILWSASELLHIWQAGVLMSLVQLLAAVALLVRLVVCGVRGTLLSGDDLWCVFGFVFIAVALYLHFRLMGTMTAPISALILLVLEVARYLGQLPALSGMLPMLARNLVPWGGAAVVLMMIGLALALLALILAVPTFLRTRSLAAREAAEAARQEAQAAAGEDAEKTAAPLDEAALRARMLQAQLDTVTRKMPRVLSHLAWWGLAVLSFALGAYVLWCHTLFGVYWLWQPLIGVDALAWVLLFVGKDMLFARQ